MIDPKLVRGLVQWLKARVPEVGDRVRPFAGPPSDVAPYLTYAGVSHVPTVAHDQADGKRGLAGFVRARVQVDVWDTDHPRKVRVAQRIVGTRADPGLHGWRAWFPADTDPHKLAVQACFLAGDPVEDDEEPDDGSEQRWYRTILEFEFHYAEGP